MPGMVRDWRGRIKGKPTQYTAIHTCQYLYKKNNSEFGIKIDDRQERTGSQLWSGKGVYQSNSVQS
jgi:hypothetical protein